VQAEREIEPKLRPQGEYGLVVDWASKWVGSVLRIAGLLHVAERQGGTGLAIDEETMAAALEIGDYFRAHALAAFAEMGADPLVEDAVYVLAWIEREALTAFTKRDAHRGCQRFKKVAEVLPALDLLEQHGYVRRLEPPPGPRPPGQPPSPTYLVNPRLREQAVKAS
jgi:hypothetical protein